MDRQAGATTEGRVPDAVDAIRDVVFVPYLACGISMQERPFRIEQNPIDDRVIHVPRANPNGRQAAALKEGIISDAGDTVRDRDAGQAAAGLEGPNSDTGDRIAFNGVRNNQFPSGCYITIGDGDLAVSRGPRQII